MTSAIPVQCNYYIKKLFINNSKDDKISRYLPPNRKLWRRVIRQANWTVARRTARYLLVMTSRKWEKYTPKLNIGFALRKIDSISSEYPDPGIKEKS